VRSLLSTGARGLTDDERVALMAESASKAAPVATTEVLRRGSTL
jgi:hypothetical protein